MFPPLFISIINDPSNFFTFSKSSLLAIVFNSLVDKNKNSSATLLAISIEWHENIIVTLFKYASNKALILFSVIKSSSEKGSSNKYHSEKTRKIQREKT